jgi:hypothetical protein
MSLLFHPSQNPYLIHTISPLGPPGQVAAVAGKKAGMKQGELGGVLKELGYTEDQVGSDTLMCMGLRAES